MNRRIILTLLANCFLVCSFAQTPDSKVVKTDSLRTIPKDSAEILIENRLVELALKSPVYSAAGHRNRINELELKKAKGNWLNLLTISTNYNDQTFAKQNPNSPIIYPKYFFGVTIPLGVIFSQGNLVKTAKEGVAFSKDQQDQLARSIKSDILGKYNKYKLFGRLIKLQVELINDISAQLSTTQENFRKGSITVDVYLTALKTNNEETSKVLQLKNEQEQIVLEIEEIIGVSLISVLQPPPPPLGPEPEKPVSTNKNGR